MPLKCIHEKCVYNYAKHHKSLCRLIPQLWFKQIIPHYHIFLKSDDNLYPKISMLTHKQIIMLQLKHNYESLTCIMSLNTTPAMKYNI